MLGALVAAPLAWRLRPQRTLQYEITSLNELVRKAEPRGVLTDSVEVYADDFPVTPYSTKRFVGYGEAEQERIRKRIAEEMAEA